MIREAVDEGMLTCAFTGGEPFLREDFEEIYCKAFDLGLRITIFTNAILIGKKQLAFLKKRIPDHVSISLYGASERSYQELCLNGNGYYRTMASIEALYVAGVPITVKTLALSPLLGEFEAIGSVGEKYQCQAAIDIYVGPGRDDPRPAGHPRRRGRVPAQRRDA
jgi:MoaA/NifB/PqqE/SkfB family radical SAM enzyme